MTLIVAGDRRMKLFFATFYQEHKAEIWDGQHNMDVHDPKKRTLCKHWLNEPGTCGKGDLGVNCSHSHHPRQFFDDFTCCPASGANYAGFQKRDFVNKMENLPLRFQFWLLANMDAYSAFTGVQRYCAFLLQKLRVEAGNKPLTIQFDKERRAQIQLQDEQDRKEKEKKKKVKPPPVVGGGGGGGKSIPPVSQPKKDASKVNEKKEGLTKMFAVVFDDENSSVSCSCNFLLEFRNAFDRETFVASEKEGMIHVLAKECAEPARHVASQVYKCLQLCNRIITNKKKLTPEQQHEWDEFRDASFPLEQFRVEIPECRIFLRSSSSSSPVNPHHSPQQVDHSFPVGENDESAANLLPGHSEGGLATHFLEQPAPMPVPPAAAASAVTVSITAARSLSAPEVPCPAVTPPPPPSGPVCCICLIDSDEPPLPAEVICDCCNKGFCADCGAAHKAKKLKAGKPCLLQKLIGLPEAPDISSGSTVGGSVFQASTTVPQNSRRDNALRIQNLLMMFNYFVHRYLEQLLEAGWDNYVPLCLNHQPPRKHRFQECESLNCLVKTLLKNCQPQHLQEQAFNLQEQAFHSIESFSDYMNRHPSQNFSHSIQNVCTRALATSLALCLKLNPKSLPTKCILELRRLHSLVAHISGANDDDYTALRTDVLKYLEIMVKTFDNGLVHYQDFAAFQKSWNEEEIRHTDDVVEKMNLLFEVRKSDKSTLVLSTHGSQSGSVEDTTARLTKKLNECRVEGMPAVLIIPPHKADEHDLCLFLSSIPWLCIIDFSQLEKKSRKGLVFGDKDVQRANKKLITASNLTEARKGLQQMEDESCSKCRTHTLCLAANDVGVHNCQTMFQSFYEITKSLRVFVFFGYSSPSPYPKDDENFTKFLDGLLDVGEIEVYPLTESMDTFFRHQHLREHLSKGLHVDDVQISHSYLVNIPLLAASVYCHDIADTLQFSSRSSTGPLVIQKQKLKTPISNRFEFLTLDCHLRPKLVPIGDLSPEQIEQLKTDSIDPDAKMKIAKQELDLFLKNKEPASWFLFSADLVVKRSCIEIIERKLKTPPKADLATNPFPTLFIQHEMCAGGTTIARHLLWRLREDRLCVVVKFAGVSEHDLIEE
jgi:hypothetical protein